MSKPLLKVYFTDFWSDFNPHDNPFIRMLSEDFEVAVDRNADLLIYSCYNFDHLNFKCHRIFYTGENVRPDYKLCDGSASFDWDDYNGRNVRFPLFRFNTKLEHYHTNPPAASISPGEKKFCCMVVSNPNGVFRNRFYDLLSQYKKVDSGGAFRNNVGGRVADKHSFIAKYKFVLSFENSSYPGYTSEKVLQPIMAGTVPVYWGNPEIGHDFNKLRIINVHQYASPEDVVTHLIKLDNDDDLYSSMLSAPIYPNNVFPSHLEWPVLSKQFCALVKRVLNTRPVAERFNFYPLLNKLKKKAISRVTSKPHWYC